MTKEEIFEEAKIRYPVGTKFKVAHDPSRICTVSSHERYKTTFYEDHVNLLVSDGDRGVEGGTVNFRGQWAEIVSKPETKPSKVLIFNDIYVGDIVVCIANPNGYGSRSVGQIYRVLEKSSKNQLYYTETSSTTLGDAKDWRKASPEEIEAYNKGIRNIKDIVKAPSFEVGKWYKRIENMKWTAGCLLYMKVSHYDPKSQPHPVRYSERIDYPGKHVVHVADCMGKDWELANINEIQEFLPTGHPDKIVKSPEFIVGRWYKLKSTLYGKFEKLGPRGNFYGDAISGGAYAAKYEFERYEDKEWTLLTDLSEIQQHLPDGHVDKIKKVFNLEKDKFYYVDWSANSNSYIFKFGDKQPSITLGKNVFCSNGGFNTSIYWKFIREATSEEKQWLEACIKANKFIPKEEALKTNIMKYSPKADEWVVYTGPDEPYWKKGKVFQVKDIWGNYVYEKNPKGSGDPNCELHNVRKAESHEIPIKTPELLIEGNWYEIIQNNESNARWVLKAGKADKKSILQLKAYCITSGSMFNYECSWGTIDLVKSYKPADMEEVYKHFPEERPKVEEKGLKYAPDYVELTSLPDRWYIIPLNGEQFDIVRKHWGDRYSQYTFHQDVNFNYLGDYRKEEGCTLITFEQFKKWVLKEQPKEQTMKFKIGDKVRFISDKSTNATFFKKGLEDLEIKAVKPNSYDYSVYEKGRVGSWGVNEDELELMPKEQVMENLEGRYLKALKDYPQGGAVRKGEYGLITKFPEGRVNFPSQSHYDFSPELVGNGEHYELMPIGWTPETEKKYTYEVVHCTTQEQWDFARKITGASVTSTMFQTGNVGGDSYNSITVGGGTSNDKGCYCSRKWYERNNSRIYSFEEWCTKFGHIFPVQEQVFKEGDWVVVTKSSSFNFTEGKAYQLGGKYWRDNPGKFMVVKDNEGEENGSEYAEFRKALPHEIPVTSTGDDMLDEAMKRYPVGTVYKDYAGYTFTVEKGWKAYWYNKNVKQIALCAGKSVVHWEGKGWATIISSPTGMYEQIKETGPEAKAIITIDAEVTHIRLPKSASVTLKNTEREVNILVKTKQTIKLN